MVEQGNSISQYIVPLPIRLTPQGMLTNFYTPSFSRGTSIHVYAVHFTPDVENENRTLRKLLFSSADEQINKLLGGHIISGINLFAVRENRDIPLLLCTANNTSYTLRLEYKHPVSLAMIQGQNNTQMVLNVIIKRALRELGLLQVTRLPKYYNPKNITEIDHLGIKIWTGYTAELTLRCGTPLLNIDFSSKIIHRRSVLEVLEESRRQYGDRGDSWMLQAKSDLEGRIVMAKYGNNRCYRIDELCFEKNPTHTFDQRGVPITYIDYFRRQYDTAIADPTQALLRSHVKRRMEEHDVYLVPELVSLTGLDDKMRADHNFMSEIAKTTRKEPQQRLDISLGLAKDLSDNPKVQAVFRNFDFQVARDPITVPSYNLSGESVQVNESHRIPVGADGNFRLGNSIFEPMQLSNWAFMATERDREHADGIVEALHQKLQEIGVTVSQAKKIKYDTNKFASEVRKLTSQGGLQIVVVLLPRIKKHDYQMIKNTTTTTFVVPTQVVTVPINEKRFHSIIEKVALQIQAKIGAQLWTVQPTPAFGRYLMVVGMDVFHDTANKKKSVLGFCATIHPNLSKYYSTTEMHETGQEVSKYVEPLFLEALNVFKTKARRYPETVIFFRDGVGDSQFNAVKEMEVRAVLRSLQTIQDGSKPYSPNIIYTVVVKKTSALIFGPEGKGGRGRGRGGRGATSTPGGHSNPPPGTLVASQIVPETGDFYLISHFANQGMSAPTLYRTVYASNPTNFPLEELARLAYRLCHMYYNWSGAIKVPAPCMMAHKIAFLVGQCVHGPVDTAIRVSPFYL